MKYLYLKVTKDEYELPLVVADSLEELAALCGKTKSGLQSMISRGKKDFNGWIRIEVDEDDY